MRNCKNWNAGWNKTLRTFIPNFWEVLKKLSYEELQSRLRFVNRGECPPSKKNRKFRDLDGAVQQCRSTTVPKKISSTVPKIRANFNILSAAIKNQTAVAYNLK